jgi:hypothetical protein
MKTDHPGPPPHELNLDFLKTGQNPQKGAKMGDFYDIDPPKRGRDDGFFKSVAGDWGVYQPEEAMRLRPVFTDRKYTCI